MTKVIFKIYFSRIKSSRKKKDDFFSLVLVVKGLLNYISNFVPQCTFNILYLPTSIPNSPMKEVSRLCISNELISEGREDFIRKQYGCESFEELFVKINDRFPNLQNLRVIYSHHITYHPYPKDYIGRTGINMLIEGKKSTLSSNVFSQNSFKNLKKLSIVTANTNINLRGFSLNNLSFLNLSCVKTVGIDGMSRDDLIFRESDVDFYKPNVCFPKIDFSCFYGCIDPLDIDWSCFPSLKHLHLHSWYISKFENLQKLERLELSQVIFQDGEEVKSPFSGLKELRELDISRTGLEVFKKDKNDFGIIDLGKHIFLRKLTLFLGENSGLYKRPMRFEDHLKFANFFNVFYQDVSFSFKIENFPCLEEVNIIASYNDYSMIRKRYISYSEKVFGKDGLKNLNILTLKNLPSLEILVLRDCEFETKLEDTPRIRILDITSSNVVDIVNPAEDGTNIEILSFQDSLVGENILSNLHIFKEKLKKFYCYFRNDKVFEHFLFGDTFGELSRSFKSLIIEEFPVLTDFYFYCLLSSVFTLPYFSSYSKISKCPKLERLFIQMNTGTELSNIPSLISPVAVIGLTLSYNDIFKKFEFVDRLERMEIFFRGTDDICLDLSPFWSLENSRGPLIINRFSSLQFINKKSVGIYEIYLYDCGSFEISNHPKLEKIVWGGTNEEVRIGFPEEEEEQGVVVIINSCFELETLIFHPPRNEVISCLNLNDLPKLSYLDLGVFFYYLEKFNSNNLFVKILEIRIPHKIDRFENMLQQDTKITGSMFPHLEILTIFVSKKEEDRLDTKIDLLSGLSKLKSIVLDGNFTYDDPFVDEIVEMNLDQIFVVFRKRSDEKGTFSDDVVPLREYIHITGLQGYEIKVSNWR